MKTKLLLLVGILALVLLGAIPLIFYETTSNKTFACQPPPPSRPTLQPRSDPNDWSPRNNDDPNDANDANDLWKDPCDMGDPAYIKDGRFNYTARDVVIKGRAMDVIIERNYQNYDVSSPAHFDFDIETDGSKLHSIEWILPSQSYDIGTYTSITEAKAIANFRLPPGGPYLVRLKIVDVYYDGGTPIYRTTYYDYWIYGSEFSYRFGHCWDISYNMRLLTFDNERVIAFFRCRNHNRFRMFVRKEGTNPTEYTPWLGFYDLIVKNADNTYTLTEKHGRKIHFDSYGDVNEIEDRNGNSIRFVHIGDPNDRKLTKIIDDLGREINLTYNTRGLLAYITDFNDRTWSYNYNSNTNNLTSVTSPTGLTTTYTYIGHDLTSVTDANGQTYLVNEYQPGDFPHRVKRQRYGEAYFDFTYYPASNMTHVTDRRGYDCNIVYNASGHIIKSTDYTEGLRATDPNTYVMSFEYDPNGEVTKKVLPRGNYTTYKRDGKGNMLTLAQEPNNGDPNIVTRCTYEPNFSFIETVTDPLNHQTAFDYDPNNGNLKTITFPEVDTPSGRKQPVIKVTYNSFGKVETVTDPCNIITKYQYYTDSNDANTNGRLWKIIVDANQSDPCRLEITTEFDYDRLGRVKEVVDPCSYIWQLVWDNNDLLRKITDPCANIARLSYNKCKKLTKIEREIDNEPNQIIRFAYDILDNLKYITDPCGYVTKLGYDYSENLSDINDAENHKTRYDYDERDLLWKVTDANGKVTEYSYDENGNLKDINDANGNVTGYHYDGFDRLRWIQYPDDTNEVFFYDKNSNVTSYRNRNLDTLRYEYDELDRLKVKSRPGEPNMSVRYDIRGRVYDVNDPRAITEGGGVTKFGYDRIGRLTEVNDIYSKSIKYQYDKRGLITIVDYVGVELTYSYDDLGRVTKVTHHNTYLGNNGVLAEYQYDELSRRTLLTYGNFTNTVYSWDIDDKLEAITNNIDETNSIEVTYDKYDKVGNRLSMQIDDANAQVYQYDKLYQLTFVDYNDGNWIGYYYDALGNRTDVNVNGTVTDYNSNSLNQYTSVSSVAYGYDENGNLTYDGRLRYYYDCENRLTEVNDVDDMPVASYKYDFAGRRVRKIVYGTPNVVRNYLYDGDRLIFIYDGASGDLLRKFYYGPRDLSAGWRIDEPIVMHRTVFDVNGWGFYYYHYDGLGSVIALSDDTGNIVEKYSYDVFGKPTIYDANNSGVSVSSVANPFMFTGREYDAETGNYYYRARYYHPLLGRFMSADPLGIVPDGWVVYMLDSTIQYSNEINLYTYVGNNPVNFVDPFGLRKKLPKRDPLWFVKKPHRRDFSKYLHEEKRKCGRKGPDDFPDEELVDMYLDWLRQTGRR